MRLGATTTAARRAWGRRSVVFPRQGHDRTAIGADTSHVFTATCQGISTEQLPRRSAAAVAAITFEIRGLGSNEVIYT